LAIGVSTHLHPPAPQIYCTYPHDLLRGERYKMKKDFDEKKFLADALFQPSTKENFQKKPLSSTQIPKKMCFIVTEKRSNSWVTDLHACERKPNGYTVFH
jgi:hypothetical protein